MTMQDKHRARTPTLAVAAARSALLPLRRALRTAQRKPRRPERTSRRSPRRASKAASPDRTASASPATTSSPSSRGSARKPLPGPDGFRLPFEFTAGTKDGGSTVSASATSLFGSGARRARCPFPTTATPAAPVVFAGYGIVVPDSQGLRLRQLRDARRQGQDRPRAALFPRGRGSRRHAAFSRATRTCATRRWPRGSAAPRR